MCTFNKNKWLVCLFLLSLLLSWACKPERESAVHPSPQSITVSEAQDWYEKKGSSQARSANDPTNDSRMAYWKYAVSTQLANGTPVVTVPLLYGFSTPVAIAQGDYTLRPGQPALVTADRDQVKIQKKLLVAKDAQGNYISNIMVILPTKSYHNANKTVKKENFEGLIQIYDKSETTYLVGLEYKNGRLVNIIKTGTAGGRASSAQRRENCYQGIYQRNPPAQVGGSSISSRWRYIEDLAGTLNIPMAVDFDTQTGNTDYTWHLVDVQEVDCNQRIPTLQPVYDPTTDQGEWIISRTGPGGGVPGGTRTDPNGPQPIDEEAPNYLSPSEALYWTMEHRQGGAIYFTAEEKAVIDEYPDVLINKIAAFVAKYGTKPDGRDAFILSAVDQQKYPRFTEIVRNIPYFVDQHDRVKQALIRHTNLPWNKILVLLKFGSGPTIVIRDLRSEFGQKAYGHTVYPGYPVGRIEIQNTFVQGLEQANLVGTQEATAFLLTVTLLHELTHYGAVDGGRNEISSSDEFGGDFEREILGTRINRDNAGQLRMLFYKNN